LLFDERIWYIFDVPLIYILISLLILSGDPTMSNSAAALREAVEFEKKALEKYKEATAMVKHAETKEYCRKSTDN
jgi:hypothetical protein